VALDGSSLEHAAVTEYEFDVDDFSAGHHFVELIQLDDLVSRRQHGNSRSPMHPHFAAAHRRQNADLPRPIASTRATATSPADKSSARGRTFLRQSRSALIRTESVPRRVFHSNYAAAPAGTGHVSWIRIASPGAKRRSIATPAATVATTRSDRGASRLAPRTSSLRTAYPSIDELSHGGRRSGRRDVFREHPASESLSRTTSVGSGETSARHHPARRVDFERPFVQWELLSTMRDRRTAIESCTRVTTTWREEIVAEHAEDQLPAAFCRDISRERSHAAKRAGLASDVGLAGVPRMRVSRVPSTPAIGIAS